MASTYLRVEISIENGQRPSEQKGQTVAIRVIRNRYRDVDALVLPCQKKKQCWARRAALLRNTTQG